MTPMYKKILLTVLDWVRRIFFACVFATLVSFWSAKWEEAQQQTCDCRAPAAKAPRACDARR